MPGYVTHLESAIDGTTLPADQIATVHNDRPLWVRYDLASIARSVTPETIQRRPPDMFRYREFLPMGAEIDPVTLGEGWSPILDCDRLASQMGLRRLLIKDESQLPTGSFKCRGASAAITMARHFGVRRVAIPSNGNAGGAMASYAARGGLECFVFMPADCRLIHRVECRQSGARIFLVRGQIHDCARVVRQAQAEMGWFDLSTMREPYRIEGKKTMGLEIAEQLGWRAPDVIVYPTGGGSGLVGIWKAFQELRQMGWLRSDTMPQMIAAQASGCPPIVRAFHSGSRFTEPIDDAHTAANGLRVSRVLGDFMVLDAIRASRGTAVAVDDEEMFKWQSIAATAEGISVCPESAASLSVLAQLVETGQVSPEADVVVINTGAAQKYMDTDPGNWQILDPNEAFSCAVS